ncbi:MAG: NAD(P)-dependent oxidoreductase [Lentisphaeria bacterium]|nr:NAD(P)-dependent oxidoreductase [Lentisphaeria bacterium]
MKILITGGSGFIGTNMVEHFVNKGDEVLNIDWNAPQNSDHQKYWENVDILDYAKLETAITKFAPDYVVHLAARTDLYGKTLDDYKSNTVGVENMVNALRKVASAKRVVFTSTQLVCARRNPVDENDYETINFYGESKKIGEQYLRSCGDLPFEYVIVRPTSIWGPWFGAPYNNFFKMILGHRYFNIGGNRAATKTFGFVGNLIYQVETLLLKSDWNNVKGKIFYLGDRPASPINEWAKEIGDLCGIRIRTVPFWIVKSAAIVGDFLKIFNIRFPMTSYRLTNMTTTFENDLRTTYTEAPDLPYTRLEGTKITLAWLKDHQ